LDPAGTVAAVRALCGTLTPTALLPLDDKALWVCSRLKEGPTLLAGASGSAADYALDKNLQLELGARVGLPVPPTEVLIDPATASSAICFPLMVKPARALYEVQGTLQRLTGVICGNREEFERAAAMPWLGPVLVQPLIRGVGEGLFGHVGPRGVTAWSSQRRGVVHSPTPPAQPAEVRIAPNQA
jgi:hypothetical protein